MKLSSTYPPHYSQCRGVGGNARQYVLATIAISLLIFADACDAPPQGPERAPSRRPGVHKAAVVGPTVEHLVWPIIRKHAAALEAADERTRFVFYEIPTDTPLALRNTLEDVTQSDCAAVLIYSPWVVNCVGAIDRLTIGGKRVVLVGTDEPRSRRAVYCGPSNSELGRAAADVCIQMIAESRQTVMLMHGKPSFPPSAARLTGFKDHLERTGTLEVFKELNCKDDPIEAQRMLRRQSRLYPRVGAFVMLDDWAFRNFEVDERLTPAEAIAVVCGDSTHLRALLRRHEIDCIISYNVSKSVESGLRVVSRLAADTADEVLTEVITPPILVKMNDIDAHEARWKAWGTSD